MNDSAEIWREARKLVQQHGPHAPARAARRAHELLDAGLIDARLEWLRVRAAAEALVGGPYGCRSSIR